MNEGMPVTDLVSQENGVVTRIVEPDEHGRTLWVRLTGDGNQHLRDVSEAEPFTCEWFALCPREATKLRSHPILASVPICDSCDAKVEALS